MMKYNSGYLWAKIIKYINRPALRNCNLDRTAKVGAGSNCISMDMGRYSYMGFHNSVFNVKIGAFCSIASNCAIGGGVHPVIAVSTSPVFYHGHNIFGKNLADLHEPECRTVLIGNDVWIGEACFIRDGISIGNGAVVGAHSVVTHDIPPYAIVAGAPAKIIKYRFKDDTIAKLQDSKWWDWHEEKLKEADFLNDAQRFVSKLERR